MSVGDCLAQFCDYHMLARHTPRHDLPQGRECFPRLCWLTHSPPRQATRVLPLTHVHLTRASQRLKRRVGPGKCQRGRRLPCRSRSGHRQDLHIAVHGRQTVGSSRGRSVLRYRHSTLHGIGTVAAFVWFDACLRDLA